MQAFESFRGDAAPFVVGIAGAIEQESDFEHFCYFPQDIGTGGRFQATRTQIIASKYCAREVKSILEG